MSTASSPLEATSTAMPFIFRISVATIWLISLSSASRTGAVRRCAGVLPGAVLGLAGDCGRPAEAERETECGPFAYHAAHMDCPAHVLYQHPRDGEAEARCRRSAGNRHIRLDERLEQRGKLVRGDTDARVAHGETQRDGLRVRLHAPDEKGHAAFMREFHSVPHKVEQDLPEPRGIPHKRLGHSFPNVKAQGGPFPTHGMEVNIWSVIKHLREVERDFLEVHFAGFDFRKIKDIIDDPQKGLGGDVDFGEVIHRRRGIRAGAQGMSGR